MRSESEHEHVLSKLTKHLRPSAMRICLQALYNPCNILAYAELGAAYELTAQSSSAFVGLGERISYWQLMVREVVARPGMCCCISQCHRTGHASYHVTWHYLC